MDKMITFPLLIRDCNIVNGDFADTVDIFVQDGIIKEIRDFISDEVLSIDNVKVIESHGMYLMAGLIDCHVHLILDGSPNIIDYVKDAEYDELSSIAAKNSLVSLEKGVMTVRDMGCKDFIVPSLKEKITKGKCQGPRVYAAGHMITKRHGHVQHISREVGKTPEDIKEAVKEQVKGGADFIKLIVSGGLLTPNFKPTDSELDENLVNVAVKEAFSYGLKTAAHVYSDKDIRTVLNSGGWTIEHGSWASTETLRKIAASDVFFVPTLKAAYNIIENADTLPSSAVDNANEVLNAARHVLPKAIKEGVCVVMGTDAGTPYNYHGDNVKEMEYMSEMGMLNEDIIKAATINSSRLIGKPNSLGQIKPGFIADMLLIDSSPLDDIKAIRKGLKYVIQEGRIIKDPYHSFLKS